MSNNQPVFEIRYGSIKATAWLNQGEHGEYHTVEVSRIYKDSSGEWQRTSSFRLSDLPKVEKVTADAYRRIYELRAAEAEAA